MKIINLRILLIKLRKIAALKSSELWDNAMLNIGSGLEFTLPDNGKKTILFAGEFLPPRISRIAKWLKRSGKYNIALLCHKNGFNQAYAEADWDLIRYFRNAPHLERYLKGLKGIDLIHSFHPKSFYPDLIRKKFNGVFLSDFQDVLSIYYPESEQPRWLKAELPHEKNCLELSSGLIAHSMEPLIARKKLGYKKPKNSIFFPLYCDDDTFVNNHRQLDLDDLHLVYAGNIAGSHRDKKQYGIIQLHWLIDALTKQKIHLHIYPSPSTLPLDYEEYFRLESQNEFLHMHKPVNQSQLSNELSKYDLGLLPFFLKDNGNTEEKFRYATTLKLFNYAEAGIPVIVTKDLYYQTWITERYRLGISLSRPEFQDLRNSIIANGNPGKLREMVVKGRQPLSLKRNIPRLIKFYVDLLA